MANKLLSEADGQILAREIKKNQSSITTINTAITNLQTAVDNVEIDVDSALSDTSENPVQNKVIKAALDSISAAGVVIDDALDSNSTNPVENKAVTAGLDAAVADIGTNRTNIAALSSSLTTVQAAIATLNGTGDGSVSKAVTDGIAGVVDGADAAFDTLKEIADWIAQDETDSADLVTKVNRNTSSIAALDVSVAALQTAIDNVEIDVDDTLSDTSENPVQNKVIKAALDGISASGVVVDTVLSDTSTNPVQNKVITSAMTTVTEALAALDSRVDDLEEGSDCAEYSLSWDADTTSLSLSDGTNTQSETLTGLVKASDLADVATSGDYDDLTNKPEIPDVSGKANTADLAAVATSGAYSDLTGTPTIPEAAEIATAAKAGLVKPGSGLNITSDGTLVVTTPADGQTQTGATNVLSWNTTKKDIEYYAVGDESNKQYLGMPDFAGQIESAKESLESEVSAVVNLVGETSGKNLLPSGGDGATKSYNGISFVVNSDGSITANGTATADAYYNLIPSTAAKTFTEGKYILSGCPAGGSASTYRLAVHQADPDTNYNDTGSAVEFATDGTKAFNAFILIRSGTTVSSLTFYPMIRPASITDSTYQPYAKTNAELTNATSNEELLSQSPKSPCTGTVNLVRAGNIVICEVEINGGLTSLTSGTPTQIFDVPERFRATLRTWASAQVRLNGAANTSCEMYYDNSSNTVNLFSGAGAISNISRVYGTLIWYKA